MLKLTEVVTMTYRVSSYWQFLQQQKKISDRKLLSRGVGIHQAMKRYYDNVGRLATRTGTLLDNFVGLDASFAACRELRAAATLLSETLHRPNFHFHVRKRFVATAPR